MASMPIPDPFDLDQLIANIEAARGRRIVIKALPDRIAAATGICGLWVKHDTRPVDLLLHARGGSPWHERQIWLHELVHLWADDATGVVGTDELLSDFSPERIEKLVAGGQVAARRRYETGIEKRTEDAAAMLNRLADTAYLRITDPTTRRLADDFCSFGGPTHL
ncbi:hypothetical protein [Streptomyces sp. FR1]|uniref:Toxin-antitoxin system, toxin component n=2 Tax=Streptomyces sp. FR1 TaxID=349971 RepID=V9Z0K2_9ACTN|nr:Hypothetical protein pFRL3_338 [Streptomyces sp. FR1]